ncbi:MAG TPA: MarR family transcriptional regulator [Verrucomicrobiae bacterium]|nr:MarR family transcriptional regulator [Verrucomicrobiae bacterium]
MTLPSDIAAFVRLYPQIYFACHRRHVRDERARRTLSLNQASILDHLDSIQPTSLHALARHMGVTASTMSLNVDRLERDGYVSRERDRRDARRIELRLTSAGARLKQQQKVLEPELVRSLLKRLTGPDRAQALHGLELLARAANEMMEGRSAEGKPKGNRR